MNTSTPSLLNADRPPVFCPGCAHELVVKATDKALASLELTGDRVVMVSDIGCSGLFDTFFHTHALHGLHGRALTYALGIKTARPDLTVIVTMGDGGLGIGGAHFMAACRRNLDINLIILNNFNFGMTGGQCSPTTPLDTATGSGFLNELEPPLDPCVMAHAAGARWIARVSAYEKALADTLAEAIRFPGFSVVETRGGCTGRMAKSGRFTPGAVAEEIASLPLYKGKVSGSVGSGHSQSLCETEGEKAPLMNTDREEFGAAYRSRAARMAAGPSPVQVPMTEAPVIDRPFRVLFLGAAGQRILTAGQILCLAAMSAGMTARQENDYPITVMRGHSISDIVLGPGSSRMEGEEAGSRKSGGNSSHDPVPLLSPGIDCVIALAPEGVAKRKTCFYGLSPDARIIHDARIEIPASPAKCVPLDFSAPGTASPDRALACLALLAFEGCGISNAMLQRGLSLRFTGGVPPKTLELLNRLRHEAISLSMPK